MRIFRLSLGAAMLLAACAAQNPKQQPTPTAAPVTSASSEQPTISAPPNREMRVERAAPAEVPKARAGVHMPDSDLTPGHASYHTIDQVCAKGRSTKDERHVSTAEKNTVYQKYGLAVCKGYCSGPQGCEIDHLISLELGGANTEDNLWPQPYDGDWNAHDVELRRIVSQDFH